MRTKVIVALGIVLSLAGCILKSTHHTVYLEPDGAVVWTVLEEDVRSDAEPPAERDREESEWLAAAREGTGDVARGLGLLGGEATTRVLRGERPFAAWTEARFAGVEEPARRLVEGLGLPGRVEVTSRGDERGIALEIDLAAVDESAEVDDALVALLDGIEGARIVLVEGRFTAAEGFALDEDGRVARPLPVPPGGRRVEAGDAALAARLVVRGGPAGRGRSRE